MSAAREARDLISDPKRWTRKYEARNANGRPVDCESEAAVRFCAMGAAYRVNPEAYEELTGRLYATCNALYGLTITALNDATVKQGGGHKRVLAVYDAVIGAELTTPPRPSSLYPYPNERAA